MSDVAGALATLRTSTDDLAAAIDERSLEHAEVVAALNRSLDNVRENLRDAIVAKEAAEQSFRDHLALPAPAGHTVITDPPPDPDPVPVAFTKRGYILKQGVFTDAQRRAGVAVGVGLSYRETLANVDANENLWDQEFGRAADAGFTRLAGRPVTGWKMPRAEMGRTLTVGTGAQSGQGQPFPAPFETNGDPNMVFIDALTERMIAMIDALLENTDEEFPVVHWPAFGQQWAEYYHGPEVRAAAGYSKDNVIRAHNAIATRAKEVADSYSRTIVSGFQLSGHGPIADMIDDWARHIGEIFEPDRAMIHANGWAYRGQWGQSSDTVDTEMDKAFEISAEDVAGLPGFDNVLAGLQAIQDWGGSAAYPPYTDARVRELFGQLRAAWADSWELYPAIFSTPQAATVKAEHERWLSEPRT